VELSHLEPLRHDEEFVLYRGRHSVQPGSPRVLLLAPTSTRPPLETLSKIEHEYSLRDELDPAWAVRPVALSEQGGRTTLVLEDPGGETLDRCLPGPMEMTRFLRVAVGIATALSGVFAEHQRKSIERVPEDVMTAVERYSWPGNIRELQNFIERSVILTRGAELQAPVADLTNIGKLIVGGRTLADANRAHIMATLRETNWVVGGRNGAATRLGVNSKRQTNPSERRRTWVLSKIQWGG
jgi:hypothetical protein